MNGYLPNEPRPPSSDPPESEIPRSPVQLDDGTSLEDVNAPRSPTSVPLQELDLFSMVQSIGVFILAGVSEIGGGWLMWKAIRRESPAWIGVIGGLVLALYGSKRAVHSLFFLRAIVSKAATKFAGNHQCNRARRCCGVILWAAKVGN
jgi:hypothetical protein